MATRWQIDEASAGQRLDKIVSAYLGIGMGEARRLIAAGDVFVGARRAQKGNTVPLGAWVEVRVELHVDVEGGAAKRGPVPDHELFLDIVFEDDAIFAVNKPAGLPSHPLTPGERGTVANSIVAQRPACAEASEDPREGGLVHRLDRYTTGVLVAAKTRAAWTSMRQSFSNGDVNKTYWALVHGVPEVGHEGVLLIDAPLVTRRGSAVVDRVAPDALPARTEVRLLVTGAGYALVEAKAHSGRLHQVRAHLASLGHSLVGDDRYGARSRICSRRAPA